MTDIVGGFTAFSKNQGKKTGAKRYAAEEPSETSVEPRQFDPEELAKIPQEDRRWSWVEIDLNAIRYNCGQIRQRIGFGRHLVAVVKSNAYGHGAVQVAQTALKAGADYLAVATVNEGIELREALINAPIMILSEPPATAISLLLAYKIMPSIYTPEFAIAYGEAADSYGLKAPYHLAINTGMNRIGVQFDEVVQFLNQISFHRALELKGVFTHFATADCPENIDFTRQVNRYVDAVNAIKAAGFDPGIVHCANTASIIRFPNIYFDMVRLGISLYGLHPSRETLGLIDLHPAMSVHARITNVMSVPVGEGVSYGCNYRSAGGAKICTIPIGYADGYPRILSGRAPILYAGERMRQVGNICMDQCMFEVDLRTRINRPRLDPQIGDEVVLVGTQGQSLITLDELADMCSTINYELACDFSMRMPRVYK